MTLPSLVDSPYDAYRERLAIMAGDTALATVINRVGQRRGWWDANRLWVSTYGRFYPEGSPYAVLVFASTTPVDAGQALCVVEAFDEHPMHQHEQDEWVQDRAGGWLRLTRFPDDAALPSIATVMAERGRPTVIRYRPGKRCTIRFDGGNGDPVLFAKIFPDSRVRLHAEAVTLWDASCAGTLAVAVPRPICWDDATSTLWQAQVAGQSVHRRLFGPDGPCLAEKMGRAIASLAISELQPHATVDRHEAWQDACKQGEELCRRVPALTGAVNWLVAELARLYAEAGPRPFRPIHGAPHAHQWLQEGERLGLVDFDGFAAGDPELDIATFMSEIDFEKRSRVRGSAANRAFLSGYEAVAGPVDRRLLGAYCAQKRLSKALKVVYAVNPEGDVRAEQALGRALISILEGVRETSDLRAYPFT